MEISTETKYRTICIVLSDLDPRRRQFLRSSSSLINRAVLEVSSYSSNDL